MKKKRILLPLATFITGIVIGFATLGFVTYIRDTGEPATPGIRVISAHDANILVRNYLSTARIPTEPILGFYLDTLQLNAIKTLVRENASLPGFRIYLGKDINNLMQGIVVGVDDKGLDAVAGHIYSTTTMKSGPCPWVCDVSSPVTTH